MISLAAGSTDVTIELFATDALTGMPRTGLAAGDVSIHYARTRAAVVGVSPVVLAGSDAAHADGGFVEIDAAAAPGWYRLDLPDAAVASGANGVLVTVQAVEVLFTPWRARLGGAIEGVAAEVHLCKAALVNQRVHTVSTGVDEIKDDDGQTTLVTMTPQDGGDDVIIVQPS
jgi:hypothetical protein